MLRLPLLIAMLAGVLLSAQEAMAQRAEKVARVGWLAAFPGPAVGMHLEGLRAGPPRTATSSAATSSLRKSPPPACWSAFPPLPRSWCAARST